MEVFLFIFVGIIAMLASAVPLRSDFDTPTRAIFAAFAMLAWAVWSFHATNVQIFTSGVEIAESYRSIMFLGIAAALVQALFLFKAVVGSLGTSRMEMEVDS